METIKLKEVRPLFVTKQGLPRKEVLLTVQMICNETGKSLSSDLYERSYQLHLARSVMSALRKSFHEHHAIFIAPEIEGEVYYGFSGNLKLQENYFSRVHKIMLAYRRIENDVKQIASGQFSMIPMKDD